MRRARLAPDAARFVFMGDEPIIYSGIGRPSAWQKLTAGRLDLGVTDLTSE
jgi:hypothetical protein